MRISLVTPSFNKAPFLEATLRSVLDQRYPKLEYGVIDGGSTDGTLDILNRYKDRLSHMVSEPDAGMYDALNKGFSKTSGEIMGYLGADDLHMPWTLSVVAEIFERFPNVAWITSQFPLTADRTGRILKSRRLSPPTRAGFFRGENLPGFSWWSMGWLQQESTFWRRGLWERVGGFDSTLRLAGDFDLWCRFMKIAPPASVSTPLAAFRRHGEQITAKLANDYACEALAAFKRLGGKPDGFMISRAREAARRLFPVRSGATLNFDFVIGDWRKD